MNSLLRKSAKVVSNNGDKGWSIARDYVEKYMDKIGVIVDYSDSHGLCYGLVFPNLSGHYGRTDSLEVFWFDPDELQIEIEEDNYISMKTLHMMDSSIENFKKGIAGKPIDTNEMRRIADSLPEDDTDEPK